MIHLGYGSTMIFIVLCRNKRLIKKENLQKEVVLPGLLTFTVRKCMPDVADVAAVTQKQCSTRISLRDYERLDWSGWQSCIRRISMAFWLMNLDLEKQCRLLLFLHTRHITKV